jgi:aspartyl protease family protein
MRRALPALVVLADLVAFLFWKFPYVLEDSESRARLLYLALLLLFVGGGVVLNRHHPNKLRDGIVWLAVFLVLILGYQQRDTLRAALLSEHAHSESGRGLELYAREDEHFYIDAELNDAPVRFMIDTGASHIVLDEKDATRAGLAPQALAYTQFFSTANGTVRGAPVRLDKVRLGGLTFANVPASVNGAPIGTSLLGLRFLREYFDVRITGDRMTLIPLSPSGGE